MIKKISIKEVATYDASGVDIDNLKKINIFYGANGSGKTTIANIIQSPSDYKTCTIEWEGNTPLNTLVYNKKFREQNFSNTKIAGVFTLGHATIEQKASLENKRTQLDEIIKESNSKKETIDKLKTEQKGHFESFKELCWNQIRHKYDYLKDAFAGVLSSKVKFAEKVIDEYQNNHGKLLKYDEIIEKSKILFAEQPTVMEIINVGNLQFSEIESNGIWSKKIIGKSDIDIAPLIQRLNIDDWVNQGRSFLHDNSNVCPFCQKKTIDDTFRKQIEDYFDENYTRETNTLKSLSQKYFNDTQYAIAVLQQQYEKESNNNQTKLDIDKYHACVETIKHIINENTEKINNKIKEPSRSIELSSASDQIRTLNNLINEANDKILEHNKLVKNFHVEKQSLIASIWKYIVEENKPQIEEYLKKNNGIEKGIAALNQSVDKLRIQHQSLHNEIIEENKNVTSVQAAVDEINRVLNLYGFNNFSIVPTNDNCYQIKRENGEIAQNTLSEGEITFITFLYFMQLVHGGTNPENAGENKVLVIDDPISSLDSTILYVVSSLIKEEIKAIKKDSSNVKQLLLLTHNVYFHKEVSFIDGRTKENNDTWYWIIRKNHNISTIQCFKKQNPIKGSYELLWDELKQSDKLSCTTLQNTMRRIYETYFKMLGQLGDEDVLNKIENPTDKEICRSLICWINDGSHCIPDDFHIGYQEDAKEKYLQVFKKIFEETNQIAHYNMMMGIDDNINEKENDENNS